MIYFTRKSSLHIVARFVDVTQAEAARAVISKTLDHAEREVQTLFNRRDGVADAAEIGRIYERHGFANDSGWCQERPLSRAGEELLWEIPEGMDTGEAQDLLVSLGALSVTIGEETEDDILNVVPHPAAVFLTEMEDDFIDIEDEECLLPYCQAEKKLLH
jgi:hypothetical protein